MRATKFIVPKFFNFVLKDTFLSLRTNDLGALFGDKVKIWGPQIDFGSPNRMYEKRVNHPKEFWAQCSLNSAPKALF